ncbi:alpha/beta fold hydrolase [Nocardia sp. bgisy118]|uniref:alpha/beta fold hydrolase n=1 Tax=Nocardia sp. bgisy118 TaxID=3413786 RepID=UPI003F4A5385
MTLTPTRLGSLHVRTLGSGPPALLWHSLFVDSTTWARVENRLAQSRTLLLVDGPCHGGNPPPTRRFTLDDCVGVAEDVLDHLGIDEPVDWLGNAWGGHVGILFAAAHPRRCRTLAAVGAPIPALTPAERRRVRSLTVLYLLVGARPIRSLLVDVLLGPDARAADPAGAALVGDAFRRARRTDMLHAVSALSLARPNLTPVLATIETPTLLTTGPADPMWTVADAKTAAHRLRNGSLVLLPAAGHVGPLIRAPELLADLVTAFWRDPAATLETFGGAAFEGRDPGTEH